jgi:argininosuccinate lyase/amino-acid N-acetyltransferase
MALWGGRFEGKSDPLFRRFNDSLPFDRRLVFDDIAGSRLWAGALVGAGVLRPGERDRLVAALDEVEKAARSDPASIAASGEEDVHSWVESQLIARVGDLGKKLHTGRSRNDQVATDLRLFTARTIGELAVLLRAAQRSLLGVARRTLDVPVPGYTHMQRGQPVLLAHWALAYFEMLDRDAARFADALERVKVLPLGCGALAGTAFPVDRGALARAAGFAGAHANSLDAVSDRDFVFETLGACVLTALHLSRLAEDLILYTTAEFGFVTFDDAVTSGSSLMPQKKNPDALELIRAKAGRVVGAQVALAVTLKGLPLAYNKDLQEDKEPLFDATDHLALALAMVPPVLDTMTVHRDRCEAAALGDGTVLSTDLADHLVDKGMPFREAHERAGRLVRMALETKTPLHRLSLEQMQTVAPSLDASVFGALTLEASLARRGALGGTSPARVREALAGAEARLASFQL